MLLEENYDNRNSQKLYLESCLIDTGHGNYAGEQRMVETWNQTCYLCNLNYFVFKAIGMEFF